MYKPGKSTTVLADSKNIKLNMLLNQYLIENNLNDQNIS